ncbi:hypothetical protein EI427_22975 [Flammeovirga pectinis]|uniref:Uncharacterized protein n=1 Tax=Flammeovirga pectinis TaxID=2494373 RepID=A0A3S9PAI4_9BACT|nr:hypothetical protein [Flammeovirga pectinis]AZQ65082.1 hypothetical protein EI427_22975 [Flammeovirga pectinis]
MNQTIFGTTVFAVVFLICIPILLLPFKGKLITTDKPVVEKFEKEKLQTVQDTYFLITTDSLGV